MSHNVKFRLPSILNHIGIHDLHQAGKSVIPGVNHTFHHDTNGPTQLYIQIQIVQMN